MDAHLAQIACHNPRLNAGVTVDEEGARARAADAALDGGEVWGPLHGVPAAPRRAGLATFGRMDGLWIRGVLVGEQLVHADEAPSKLLVVVDDCWQRLGRLCLVVV